jgi:hypothetical protein
VYQCLGAILALTSRRGKGMEYLPKEEIQRVKELSVIGINELGALLDIVPPKFEGHEEDESMMS